MIVLLFALMLLLSLPQGVFAQKFSLPDLVRQTMQIYFEGPGLNKATMKSLLNEKVPREYNRSAGVFVTLSKDGSTRGCWGSIQPSYPTIAQSTVFATLGALKKDYRCKPIRASEWKTLKPQVTVIEQLQPISSIAGQNAMRDGLMLRAGGKSAILLPGEVSDAYYQLVKCKLKAGVNRGEPYQLYKVKAAVYE
jgi:AMMECR1 domain-containing protein